LHEPTEESSRCEGDIIALVAPHIDLSVGTRAYAAAYGALGRAWKRSGHDARPDLVIILGTGHSIERGIFCLTDKDFRTPLGTMPTDRDMVARLRAAGGECIAENDLPHRREHSIEFQLLFLQHLLGGDHGVRIVPVLCGSFHPLLTKYESPSQVPGVGEVLSVFREAIRAGGRKALVVAGVDLSHVGPKFGDKRSAKTIAADSKAHDEALQRALGKGDAREFWAESRRVRDRFHVCGFPALACLLEILPPCRYEPLHYDIWFEDATDSAVSFAAGAFVGE
jgi:AmmeMemoRadiSam system protein B